MKKILFLLFTLIPLACFGATYYIDPGCANNGDGTACGCASSPGGAGAYNTWAGVTLSGANSYLQKAGTTATNAYINISSGGIDAGHRLIIGSYDGLTGNTTTQKATLNGYGNGYDRVINCNLKYHVAIQDMEIVLDDSYTQANRIGIAIPSSGGSSATDYDNIIQRVWVHDILNDESAGDFANGIRAINNGGLKILDCVIDNIGTDCIYAGGDNMEIKGNVVFNAGQGALITGDEIQLMSGRGWEIGNNVFRHSRDEKQAIMISVMAGSGTIRDNTVSCYEGGPAFARCVDIAVPAVVVENNRIEGSGIGGTVFLTDEAGGCKLSGNTIVTPHPVNSAVYNNAGGISVTRNTILYSGTETCSGSGIHETSNIFNGESYDNIIANFAYGIRSKNNDHGYNDIFNSGIYPCANSDGTQRSCGTGTITDNPLFVSTTDFHLQENSPARNAASDGGDMGAYEYVVSSEDVTAPDEPENLCVK